MATSHSNARRLLSAFPDSCATILTSFMIGVIKTPIAVDRRQGSESAEH
jgi:hypothetical protein